MSNKIAYISAGISSAVLIILIYNSFLIPSHAILEIGMDGGNAIVNDDFSEIEIRSYSPNQTKSVMFLVKVTNDGGTNLTDSFLEMDFQPRDPDWLNPGTVPLSDSKYLPCSTGLATKCHIGIISKGESVIVPFSGALDPQIYFDIKTTTPSINLIFYADNFKKIEKTVKIIIPN